jgi:acetyl esterase
MPGDLDPQVKALLEKAAAEKMPGFNELPLEEARALFRGFRELAGPPEEVGKVEDRALPDLNLTVRVYTPKAKDGGDARPGLVYFHGGGWIIGDLDTTDAPLRKLANASGCVVVSVDYRLAPEHKFPVAAEDCYAATRYVARHPRDFGVDPKRLAVGGDSAGGNLAAVVALMARDRGGPPVAFQLLIYPVLNNDFETASYKANATGYGLTRAAMEYYWKHYLPRPEDGEKPYASPLRARDLGGRPPSTTCSATRARPTPRGCARPASRPPPAATTA